MDVPPGIHSLLVIDPNYNCGKPTSDTNWKNISPSLLRLFESNLFSMDLALQYMFRNEDPSVRAYLARRLLGFEALDVDFYLPQLVSLYHHSSELAKYLHPYFICRCIRSTEFAIHLIWLLDTFDPPKQDSPESAALSKLPSALTFSFSLTTAPGSSIFPPSCEYSDTGVPVSDNLLELKGVTITSAFSTQRLRDTLLPYDCTPSATPSQCFFFEGSSFSSVSAIQCSAVSSRSAVESVYKSKSRYCGSCTALPPHTDGIFVSTHNDDSASHAVDLSRKRIFRNTTNPPSCRRSQSLRLRPTFETNYINSSSIIANSDVTTHIFDDCNHRRLDPVAVPLAVENRIFSDPCISFFSHRTVPTVGSDFFKHPNCRSYIAPLHTSQSLHRLFFTENTSQEAAPHTENWYCDPPSPGYLPRLQSQLTLRLMPEWHFIDSLLRLAHRLLPIASREQRTAYLQAELANLNLCLPARVWIPVNKADHIILRIPPTAAVCLNSKNKAPYLIYMEVLSCADPWAKPLPSRPTSITSSQLAASSSHTGATSLTSLPGCPWNSSTPSSFNGSGVLQTPDALSLLSDDSVVHLGEAGACPDSPSVPEYSPSQLIYGSTLTDVQATDVHLPYSLSSPTYVGASQIRNRLKEQSVRHPRHSFVSDPDDPSAAVLKEPWHMKCQRIRALSPWGSLPGWRLSAAIVKVGDDLRQEQLAYQLLSVLQRIWQAEHIPLWLRPLKVIVTSPDSGLIEPVPDTVSFHQIRRHARLSLLEYLLREHGPPNSEAFLTVQRNFVHSCAAYSIVGYLLQVKDRHNGNILLDNEGHVIHIDYGFMLSASPGKNIGFESSPFKLTAEQVAVMGGVGSDMFEYFKCLLLRGLLAARKHMEELCVLVEIARKTCPQLPCFVRGGGSTAVSGLRQRFQLSRTEEQLRQSTERMVEASLHSITTKLYDSFQYYTNGIQ